MTLEFWNIWIKGIRIKSLKRLLLLMAKYCYGYEGVPFIDFHGRYGHKGVVLNEISEVVELFTQKEGISQRTAYDYAIAIERIQFLTR